MRFVVAILLSLLPGTALASCPSTPSDCPAPTFKSLTVGGAGTALSVTNNATIGGVTTLGAGSNNKLTLTPGSTSSTAIALTQSGTGGINVTPAMTLGVGSGGSGTGLTVNNAASIAHIGTPGLTTGYNGSSVAALNNSSVFMSGINMTGTTGSGSGRLAPFIFNVAGDSVDNSANTSFPLTTTLFSHIFGGTKGSIGTVMIVQNQTSATVDVGDPSVFYNTLQVQNSMGAASGSSNANAIALNALTNLGAAATNWGRVEGAEIATQRVAGSSVQQELVLNLIRTAASHASSWEGMIGFQSTLGSATRSNALLLAGTPGTEWPLDSTNGWVFTTLQQTTANPASAQTNPQKAAGGFDFWPVNFSASAMRSSGVNIKGTAEIDIGPAVLSYDGSGLSLDTTGFIAAINTVSTAGTGYQVNDELYDGIGGIIKVSTVNGSGGITAAAYIAGKEPFNYGGAGGGSVSTTGGSGNGAATFTLTWTAKPTMTIGGTAATAIGIGNSGSTTTFAGAVKFPALGTPAAAAPAFTNAPTGCTNVVWVGPFTAAATSNIYLAACHP